MFTFYRKLQCILTMAYIRIRTRDWYHAFMVLINFFCFQRRTDLSMNDHIQVFHQLKTELKQRDAWPYGDRPNDKEAVSMSSTNYLSVVSSSGFNPMMGTSQLTRQVTSQLNKYYQRPQSFITSQEECLLLGILLAVVNKQDVIIVRQDCNRTIRRNVILAQQHIQCKLVWCPAPEDPSIDCSGTQHSIVYMISESVSRLSGCLQTQQPQGCAYCRRILDDSHGLCMATAREYDDYWLVIGSLSHVLQSSGGYIVGPQDVIDFLSYNPLLPRLVSSYHLYQAHESFQKVIVPDIQQRHQELCMLVRRTLAETIAGMSNCYTIHDGEHTICSPIIPLIFPHQTLRVLTLSQKLFQEYNISVEAVVYPYCSFDEPRLYIRVSLNLTLPIIREFCQSLRSANDSIHVKHEICADSLNSDRHLFW